MIDVTACVPKQFFTSSMITVWRLFWHHHVVNQCSFDICSIFVVIPLELDILLFFFPRLEKICTKTDYVILLSSSVIFCVHFEMADFFNSWSFTVVGLPTS